jgi:hypothetical protein
VSTPQHCATSSTTRSPSCARPTSPPCSTQCARPARAHPQRGERVSDLVYAVAITNDVNPVALQHDVEQYADALDA